MAHKLYQWVAKGGTNYFFDEKEIEDTSSWIKKFQTLETSRISKFPEEDRPIMKGRTEKAVTALKQELPKIGVWDNISASTDIDSYEAAEKDIKTAPRIMQDALKVKAEIKREVVTKAEITKRLAILEETISVATPGDVEQLEVLRTKVKTRAERIRLGLAVRNILRKKTDLYRAFTLLSNEELERMLSRASVKTIARKYYLTQKELKRELDSRGISY